MISFKQILIAILIFLLPCFECAKPVQFVNGGYRGLVVAIHSEVPESEQLISNLEELLRKSSEFLYKATNSRARFVEIDIIIPQTWSQKENYEQIAGSHYDRAHVRVGPTDPDRGDEPFTFQPRGCGESGEYIKMTDAFIEELNTRTKDDFGNPEKHFVHEWAHYRYGVFDEYGVVGNSKYPTFYMENGTVYPTACVQGIKGKQEDRDGKPCKIYSGGKVDPWCSFIPDKTANHALASIMFMPHIDSIEKFCQDKPGDPLLHHNKFAPSKHNIICNHKSTSEVIENHQDFKNLNISSLSDKYYEPVIRLFRIDERQSSRFVLVLDVSGSMKENGRINLLHRAATRFVKDLIPNGMELGIIEFSTDSKVLHKMVTINETTRRTLAESIPQTAEGWTAIGKAFKSALEILRENGGDTRGATVILVSDGEENQKEPTIEEIMPEMLDSGVRIDSIAVAVEADRRLENISSLSGGRCFYMKDEDDATNTVMETAFLGFVSQQNDVEVQAVTIKNRDLKIIKNRNVIMKVIIDSELGKNTKFIISSNDIDKLNVKIKSPDSEVFKENHQNFKLDKTQKKIEVFIPDSEVGLWEIIYSKNIKNKIIVSLTVTSEPKQPSLQPIRLNTYFGKLEVRYPATALLFAEVKKGQNPVIGAQVVATVERPESENVEVFLLDDGTGSDISANDGIYTTVFTQFTSNGRYSVSAKVSTIPSQTRIRTQRSYYAFSRSPKAVKVLRKSTDGSLDSKSEFRVSDFIPSSGKPEDDIETEPIHDFTRESEAGSFKLENFDPKVDLMPPGRVTNLRVVSTDEEEQIVELEWTAPGDDAFYGNVTKVELRSGLSQSTLLDPNLFENNIQIIDENLVAGSLEPAEGGSFMRAKFQIPNTLYKYAKLLFNDKPKIDIYFALRATDESNNTGEISNLASVHFGYVKTVFDNIIIGTNSRPFETTVIQTHVDLPNPVLFHHNRILMQRSRNQTSIKIPKELGRNTKFTITSDDLELLDVSISSPNGTIYSKISNNYNYDSNDMTAEYKIDLANSGKWKILFEKKNRETVIAYLSVTSESRVDEPIKVRAWMDTPFHPVDKPPSAVINAEVTKRYNYIICAQVVAIVDRPKADPIVIQLHDNGLGADKVANDGLYSGVFNKFNINGRYGVTARVLDTNTAMLKLGVEDEKIKCN